MEGPFIKLCPAFRQIGRGQRALTVSVSSQIFTTQNNPYAKVACLGVAFSAILRWQICPGQDGDYNSLEIPPPPHLVLLSAKQTNKTNNNQTSPCGPVGVGAEWKVYI